MTTIFLVDMGWPLDSYGETEFEEYIHKLSNGFLTVVDSTIYLIHHTAKQFLSNSMEELSISQSHHFLARTCTSFLKSEKFEARRMKGGFGSVISVSRIRSLHSEYPFFLYAARHWPVHFNKSEVRAGDDLMADALALCDISLESSRQWLKAQKLRPTFWEETFHLLPQLPVFAVAAIIGINPAVEHLLKTQIIDLNFTIPHSSWPMLMQVMKEGHLDTVKLLLAHGANANASSVNGFTCLHYALEAQDSAMVKLLVEKGNADPTHVPYRRWEEFDALNLKRRRFPSWSESLPFFEGEKVASPLAFAIRFGTHVEYLLEVAIKGGKLQPGDEQSYQLIGIAAGLRNCSSLNYLIERLGTRNSLSANPDRLLKNALRDAVYKGHYETVKLLLERFHIRPPIGIMYHVVCPSDEANAAELRKIVHLLLDYGTEVGCEIRDILHNTLGLDLP